MKPKILISRCLERGHCRYDGSQIASPFIKRIEGHVEIIDVCPEMAIGLPAPREALRLLYTNGEKQLVGSMNGEDHTEAIKKFSKAFLNMLKDEGVHGAILKSRSPSCGIKDVKMYNRTGKATCLPEKSNGLFGEELRVIFPMLPIENEGRLRNYNIRDHFLTRIYALVRYDNVIAENSVGALVRYHSENKYLLMAYNQAHQKTMGKLVANNSGEEPGIIIERYKFLLHQALKYPMNHGRNVNMLMHLFGYFKKELYPDEKVYFLDLLEQYNSRKIPFSVPRTLIYSWVLRYGEDYLKNQTIFNPYPIDILDVSDSGKGKT